MEIAIGSAIAAAISAAGSAAATAVAAHPFLFTAAALTAAAAGTTAIVGGVQANNKAKLQASQINTQIQGEQTQNAIEAEARAKRLRMMLASQNAIFGSNGIALDSGTPSTIAGDTYDQAQRQQVQADMFSDARQSILGLQSADALSAGRAALTQGAVKAAGSLINFGSTIGAIGSAPGAIGTITKGADSFFKVGGGANFLTPTFSINGAF